MREDLIRDFLNTTLIPGEKDPLLKYLLPFQLEEDRICLAFEVPTPLISKAQEILPEVELQLKKLFPNHQIICVLTAKKNNIRKSKLSLENVNDIICIASGKGGVGKSTTALNLAIALQQSGKRVGILDADIYGPSLPQLLGLTERPKTTPEKKLIPLEKHGLQAMSIGLMLSKDAPVIWRGPMVQGALQQLLKDVDWNVDILVIDMPPGTGDAHLTLAQQVSLSGSVIVSTPQDIALIDARRAISMFQQVAVPILGIIENMSYFECPNCHHVSHIFHHQGAQKVADEIGISFLGEIPLDMTMRIGSDEGKPITIFNPENTCSQQFKMIAESLLSQLASRKKPDIQFNLI